MQSKRLRAAMPLRTISYERLPAEFGFTHLTQINAGERMTKRKEGKTQTAVVSKQTNKQTAG